MKDCEACNQQTNTECAWLIEGDGLYFDGHHPDSRGFTREVNNALRFARFEDGETVKHWILQPHAFALRTTKHCWINGEHQ